MDWRVDGGWRYVARPWRERRPCGAFVCPSVDSVGFSRARPEKAFTRVQPCRIGKAALHAASSRGKTPATSITSSPKASAMRLALAGWTRAPVTARFITS
jgi:hypothetical protein